MKYLSIDLEATGLNEDCLIIEFAAVPFDAKNKIINKDLSFHIYLKCPSFETLKPSLDSWVIEHNKNLIDKANQEGFSLVQFKEDFSKYLESVAIVNFFGKEKITLFGKSMNAIDLPFLNRDLGWNYMRKYFNHKILDLSSVALSLIDVGLLNPGSDSSTELMKHFEMGEVVHTALGDAINTAQMYLNMISEVETKISC